MEDLLLILSIYFQEADLNQDGKIDWEEFLEMMLPGHSHSKAVRDQVE